MYGFKLSVSFPHFAATKQCERRLNIIIPERFECERMFLEIV